MLRLASDERLVALVRDGSQPAFEVMFDRHHRGILSFCRHMVGTQEEAEDAVQHTFMAAYRDLLSSDKDIQLRAWLYTIARNRCLSVLRARRERPSDELEDVATVGLASQVEVRQDLQDMLRDLAALAEDQRAALVLSELGDMPHDEIAAVIGCPKDKVKALVFQARSSLHASREARDTDCTAIRELLSSLRGGALRRTTLRRHLRDCPGCRDFANEVKRQRKAMAVILPVVPTLGLRESALAAAFGGGTAAGGAAAGGAALGGAAATAGSAAGGAVATGGTSALLAKVLVVAAVAGGGAAGVSSVTDGGPRAARDAAPASERGSGPKAPLPGTAPAATTESTPESTATPGEKARRRGHDDRGKEFAKTRGKGAKRGLLGTQPGQSADKEAKRAEKRAQAKAKARAKKKANARKKAPARRAKPVATPKPAPTPRPERTPRSEKNPRQQPTPEPTPAATVPEPAPTSDAGSGDSAGDAPTDG